MTVFGQITIGEFLEYRRSLVTHPDFKSDCRALMDLTQAAFPLHQAEIRRLAGDTPFSTESRRAVVVADDLHYVFRSAGNMDQSRHAR